MQNIDDYLFHLERYCHSVGIQVKWAQLDPHTPPASDPEAKTIVMNSNWYFPRQFALQLCHEISHILNGDAEFSPLYFRTTFKPKFEQDATSNAIRMLVQMYMGDMADTQSVNYVVISHVFGIPDEWQFKVKNEIAQFKPQDDSWVM